MPHPNPDRDRYVAMKNMHVGAAALFVTVSRAVTKSGSLSDALQYSVCVSDLCPAMCPTLAYRLSERSHVLRYVSNDIRHLCTALEMQRSGATMRGMSQNAPGRDRRSSWANTKRGTSCQTCVGEIVSPATIRWRGVYLFKFDRWRISDQPDKCSLC